MSNGMDCFEKKEEKLFKIPSLHHPIITMTKIKKKQSSYDE